MMKLDSEAKGVYVIAPTPFHPDGKIDESSIDRMTDFFLEAGVTGMTVLGQLGEAPKMAHDESVGIVKRVLGRANLPVIVGVSAPGFAAMRALTQDVMALGAAGVMIAASFWSLLAPITATPGTGLWMRQMTLGPSPEFCLQAPAPVALPRPIDARHVTLRTVFP